MGRCKRPTIQPGDGLESWTPILFDGADDDDLLLLNDAVYVGFDIDDVRPRWHLAAILVFAIPEEFAIRRHFFTNKNLFDSSSFDIEEPEVYKP